MAARLRRSLHFVPGGNERMAAGAKLRFPTPAWNQR